MKQALVVGGTGFIGLGIVDELLARGVEVRATRRKSSVTLLLRKRPVELVDGSLEDRDSLARAMQGCDVVFLAAGYYPRYSLDRREAIDTGVEGVRNTCRAALDAGVSRLVYTSTIATVGAPSEPRPANEDDIPSEMPEDSVYRAAKWAMEREVEKAAADGLDAVTLLPGGCLGPGELRLGTGGIVVGTALGALPWWVDGLVHIVDVADVARAHVEAATLESPSSRYLLAGRTVRVERLLRTIVRRYGGRMPPEELDIEAARLRADEEERQAAPLRARVPIPRELVDVVACGRLVSSARADYELGFRPRPFEQTLDRAHEWFVRCKFLPALQAETRRTHEHG